MNPWGISWGDSWGSSWGPLHEVDDRPVWDTSQGMAPSNMRGYIDRMNREYNRANRLASDDRAATEFIMALVHSEILYGAV